MKKIRFKKILLFLLIFVFSFLLLDGNVLQVKADINVDINTKLTNKTTIKNTYQYKNTTKINITENYFRDEETLNILNGIEKNMYKENCVEDFSNYMAAANSLFELGNSIRMTEGDDFDTAACFDGIMNTAASIAACFGPYGMIVSAGISSIKSIIKAGLGGQNPDSEITQMQYQINSKLNELNKKIEEVDEHIVDLSNKVDQSTQKIIDSITTELDNKEAKIKVDDFMNLSNKDDFSYKFFKNYILGSNDYSSNIYASTAYYYSLKESIDAKDPENIILTKYDRVYSSIMNNMDIFLSNIITENDKSIVQYYYDVLCSNPELCGESSPEIETLKFSDDLYNTFIKAYQIIGQCNIYYASYMSKYDLEEYQVEGYKKILLNEIINENNQINELKGRLEKLDIQTAKDLVYILNLNKYYLIKEENNYIHEVSTDSDSFGKLVKGQTVYFNSITDYVSEYFNLNKNDFIFKYSCENDSLDTLLVNDLNNVKVELYYKSTLLYKLDFTVTDNYNSITGTGEEDDPFLISTPEQFMNIQNNLDKHFVLINDIDLSNFGQIIPFGNKIINNKYEFDEFTGTLNGNGFSIKNLTVDGNYEKVGLFGIVGEEAIISNINFINPSIKSNVNIAADPDQAMNSESEFFGGIIAGINNGIIKYCSISSDRGTEMVPPSNYYIIDNVWNSLFNPTKNLTIKKCGLEYKLNNAQHNINLTLKIGGIAGQNNNLITCCKIEEIKVIGASKTNIGGQRNTNENQNNVFVGGITGYNYGIISFVHVSETTQLGSSARTEHNANTTISPMLISYVGGITAFTINDDYSRISNVCSEANPLFDSVQVDAESGYGEFYKKAKSKNNPYIPDISDSNKNLIISDENIKDIITICPDIYNIQYEFVDKNNDNIINGSIYGNNNPKFDCSELVLKYNNKEIEYEFISCYNFNTTTDDKSGEPIYVTILFKTEIDGIETILSKEISVVIKNSVICVEIANLQDFYKIDDFTLNGLILRLYYRVGDPMSIELTDEYIKENNIRLDQSSFKIGENKLSFSIGDCLVKFKTNIYCDHGNYFNLDSNENFVLKEELSEKPTCSKLGINIYECTKCGEQKEYYLPMLEHVLSEPIGYQKATCNSIGSTGEIRCLICKDVLFKKTTIPLIPHVYKYLDENQHQCSLIFDGKNCTHIEPHNFLIQDSVQLLNLDGENKYYIVLNKQCYDCKYELEEIIYDKNIEENLKSTKLIVSNGYVLPSQNTAIVYIHLINNNYIINGANFGIRYNEHLKLVNIEDGNLFSSGWELKNGTPINQGYNFFCATGQEKETFTGDGILLKLTFEILDEIKEGNVYDINVVYSNGIDQDNELVVGGFSIENGKKQLFTTEGGNIYVVNHLPGDVNEDGSVDIMDAVLISKYLNDSSNNNINKVNANVNLSIPEKGESEVDIYDAVAILKYIIGSYTDNPLHQVNENKFNINLNYNISYKENSINYLTTIEGDFYYLNENNEYVPNSYVNIGLDKISMDRNGYKFLGWYTSPYGGKKINFYYDSYLGGNPIPIDPSIDTLYAHWELNTVTILPNDSTHKYSESDIYILSNGQINTLNEESINDIDNGYEKKNDVIFNSDIFGSKSGYINYSTCNWQILTSDYNLLNEFMSLYEAIIYLREIQYYGKVYLKPNYSNPTLDFESIINAWTNKQYDKPILKSESNITIEDVSEVMKFCYNESSQSYIINALHKEKIYKVYFNFNGGSDKDHTFPYDKDNYGNQTNFITVSYSNPEVFTDLTKNKVNITRENYIFSNWAYIVDDKTEKTFDQMNNINLLSIIENENYTHTDNKIELKINWSGKDIKVQFIDQSGEKENQITEIIYQYGDKYINDTTEKYFDDDFKWNINPDGTGDYINNDSIVKITSDFRVYKIYNYYTVSLNINSSNKDDNLTKYSTYMSVSNINDTEFDVNFAEKFSLPVPTSEYYIFDGWYYKNKQITDAFGHSLTKSNFNKNNYTLTAHWKKIKDNYTYIKNNEDLKMINNNTSGSYYLINDITLNENWVPLNTFFGKLDGNNKKISNLNYYRKAIELDKDLYIGLFSINHGEIENLNIYDSHITVETYHDGNYWIYAGLICGYSSKTITNCNISSSSVTIHRDKSEFGMLTGTNDGTIENCQVNTSTVYGNGDAGGISGGLCGTITQCVVKNSTIKHFAVNSSRASGGIVGYNNQGTINSCEASSLTFTIDGDYKLKPSQGIIVGHQKAGAITYVRSNLEINKETLNDFKIEWTTDGNWKNLWQDINHKNENYFGIGWGYAGKLEGNFTIK